MASIESLAAIGYVAGGGRQIASEAGRDAGRGIGSGGYVDAIAWQARGAIGVLDGLPRLRLGAGIRIVPVRGYVEVTHAAINETNSGVRRIGE